VRETLEIMLKAVKDGNDGLFPPVFQQMLAAINDSGSADLERKRLAVDYVAGMTEREIARKHLLLTRG